MSLLPSKGPITMGIRVEMNEFWEDVNIHSIEAVCLSNSLRPFGLLVLLPSRAQHHFIMFSLSQILDPSTDDLA